MRRAAVLGDVLCELEFWALGLPAFPLQMPYSQLECLEAAVQYTS